MIGRGIRVVSSGRENIEEVAHPRRLRAFRQTRLRRRHLFFPQWIRQMNNFAVMLARVKIVGVNGGWKLFADPNVPLRIDWNHENFAQLVLDLLS
jgi:hypothetical protein